MEVVVSPVLHKKLFPPDAVSVALFPVQTAVGPLMVVAAAFVTVIVVLAALAQVPLPTSTE